VATLASPVVRCLLAALVACFAVLLRACPALADGDLAAGVAARAAAPPDLAGARAHFERAAHDADDRTAAEALFFLAELDEGDLHFKSALEHYEASAARLPSSRYTPRANSRARELRTHSEGDFAPLVQLETVRRSPALSGDPSAIEALVRSAASFPPGKVQVEARMLVAEAYLGRLARPADALPLLQLVVDDPNAEVLTAREAASELVQTYVARHDLDDALRITQRYPKLLGPTADRAILRLKRRRPLRLVAIGDLALLAGFALLGVARPGRARVVAAVRRVAPLAIVFSAFACGVGGFLASRYEQTSPYPFAAMFPAMFAVAISSRAWSASGSPVMSARVVRAVLAFAGVFAAAFLMLDRMDPIYLQGFGL
jgi:hypothetical protein